MAAVPSLGTQSEGETDRYPLLIEEVGSCNMDVHVVDITRLGGSFPATGHGGEDSGLDRLQHGDENSTSVQASDPPVSSAPLAGSSSANAASSGRRGENYGRRHRSPLNSGLWISIELLVNVSQIVAAVIVLVLSRHEHPQAPLFSWVIGYTAGCVATLPLLCWRYVHRNGQGSEQDSANTHQGSQTNPPGPTFYTAISISQVSEGDQSQNPASSSQSRQNSLTTNPRLNQLVDHFKMALDCFFAVWFVVGNVWVFGGHSSAADAPNLYRLCIVFLTFSCIGYAMPFILCAMICCCLPCIISIMGFREDSGQNRGATVESINALPTYKFKTKKSRKREASEANSESQGEEGGILAAGTDKERAISAEDAVCCICLAKFADGDELRELPCAHFFHKECVDKWLKINALCPLCKSEVGDTADSSSGTNQNRHDRRVGNGEPSQEPQ